MGLLLSSGFRAVIFLSCFLDRVSLFDWNPVSSSRAVLQSRRAQVLSRLAVAPTFPSALRLYLDSSEHGGTLDAVGMTIRGSPPSGANHRATTLYSVGPSRPDHDAVMRIGGEAPKRRTLSLKRL
jgi:hypothetical protein